MPLTKSNRVDPPEGADDGTLPIHKSDADWAPSEVSTAVISEPQQGNGPVRGSCEIGLGPRHSPLWSFISEGTLVYGAWKGVERQHQLRRSFQRS